MRAIIIIMDSFGIGAAPDAERFGYAGANTLGHIAEWCTDGKADHGRTGPLHIPNLERLGVGLAAQLAGSQVPAGLSATPDLIGAYATAREVSSGKDTPSGHWELTGVPVRFDWGYFSKPVDTFPPALLEALVRRGHLPAISAIAMRPAARSSRSSANSTCTPASRSSTRRPTRCSKSPARAELRPGAPVRPVRDRVRGSAAVQDLPRHRASVRRHRRQQFQAHRQPT
jgi:hypothetical protein